MSSLDIFLQQLVNGISTGMIYALIALGYTMVYGIVQLINFAHGEVFMLGAYIGLSCLLLLGRFAGLHSGYLLFAAMILLAMVFTGLLGLLVERFAYRPLRSAPRLAPLITAIGISFLLQNVVMLVYGPVDQSVPDVVGRQSVMLGSVPISHLQLLIAATAVGLMLLLQLFIQKTRSGKAMRALADDAQAASLMGINVTAITALAFVLGSCLAGAGGVMFGAYYNTINFHDGYLAGLKAFTAAVLGGVGNIPGAMLGGLLLGVLEALAAGYISSEWKNAVAFFVLLLILLFRPQGLLGSRVVKKV